MGQPLQKKTVYFVRHGQSNDNAAAVMQSVHSPLSDLGKIQAGQIADRLAEIPFDTLIASPLKRTKQTARYISEKTHKEPHFSDLFVERVKPHVIDGKPFSDKAAVAIWHEWEESLFTPGKRVDDGENYDDITLRAHNALTYLESLPEQTIAVVTHGYFLRVLVAHVLLGSALSGDTMKHVIERTSIENTSLTVFHYEKLGEEAVWHLAILNDHSHF